MSMEKVSRRDLLQCAGAVAAATALSGFAWKGESPNPLTKERQPAGPAFEWIRSVRLMIAEGYAPPFFPSLDLRAEEGFGPDSQVELQCVSLSHFLLRRVLSHQDQTPAPSGAGRA